MPSGAVAGDSPDGARRLRIRQRTVELAHATPVGIALILTLVLVVRVLHADGRAQFCAGCLGFAGGFLTADVASAFVHWFCDTYFGPDTPVIGRRVIAPFREHHRDPLALARHGVFERNGNNCLAALPLLALASLGPLDLQRPWPAAGEGLMTGTALTLCLANQIHAWAHAPSRPAFVRFLQRCGVLLSPGRHEAHHQRPHSCAYAIVSGWSNRWLDTASVPARAESLLARVGFCRRGRGGDGSR